MTKKRTTTPASGFHWWRPHPWHGLSPGKNPPHLVQAFIEITPFDYVKYEVDKESGYIVVDRPQRTSAQPPALYGFIPKTYCAEEVLALTPGAEVADGDPLDVCIISERRIDQGGILVNARVVGGVQMLDGGEADDKIIAVLDSDHIWADARDISDIPDVVVQRLCHYFATYKMDPSMESDVQITGVYGREHAETVVEAALTDYQNHYGELSEKWAELEDSLIRGAVRPE